MIQIRQSVFETNSSSMHSIAIRKKPPEVKKNLEDQFFIYKDGEIDLSHRDNEFGRAPFRILYNLAQKLPYVIAYYCGNDKDPDDGEKWVEENIYPIMEKYLPRFKYLSFGNLDIPSYHLETEEELPEEERKAYHFMMKEVEWVGYSNGEDPETAPYSPYGIRGKDGTVIHLIEDKDYEVEVTNFGSLDHDTPNLDEFMKAHNISLEEFLVDEKYIIVVDGDEYCIFEDMIDNGVIPFDSFEELYPEYGWVKRLKREQEKKRELEMKKVEEYNDD